LRRGKFFSKQNQFEVSLPRHPNRKKKMPVKSTKAKKNPRQEEVEESVWIYRGYHLKTSEFVTVMVHLYRAEMQRANVWRQRLDTTTNWAVIATSWLDSGYELQATYAFLSPSSN
jgi:uncharacterized membrane protein